MKGTNARCNGREGVELVLVLVWPVVNSLSHRLLGVIAPASSCSLPLYASATAISEERPHCFPIEWG